VEVAVASATGGMTELTTNAKLPYAAAGYTGGVKHGREELAKVVAALQEGPLTTVALKGGDVKIIRWEGGSSKAATGEASDVETIRLGKQPVPLTPSQWRLFWGVPGGGRGVCGGVRSANQLKVTR
jgi:hypothetical protein